MPLAQVRGGSFVSVELRRSGSVHPEWHTVVVDEQGAPSLVRVSASGERVLSSGTPPAGEAPGRKENCVTSSCGTVPARSRAYIVCRP